MVKKTRIYSIFSQNAKRFLLGALLCLVNCAFCISQDIRFHLWASLDAYPESESAADIESGVYDYPIAQMKEVAPFLIEGMVYGWKFTYTPSDKARGVEEFFEIEPIQPEPVILPYLSYESPWISEENNRLNCWVRFKRNDFHLQNYKLWSSIENPCISGRGTGALEKGFEGIKEAASDAVKQAVRAYYRNEIKNKPKEITGSVLIRKPPVLGILSGNYSINLDFFLESDTIINYTVY